MIPIRKSWFRISLVAGILIAVNFYAISNDSFLELRENSTNLIKSIAFIFAIISTLSLAIFFNYIRGLRKDYAEQIRRVRKVCWEFYEKHNNSPDQIVRDIIDNNVSKLLKLSFKDFFNYENYHAWSEEVECNLSNIKTDKNEVIFKHLTLIEDEINELGLLYVRNVVSLVHYELINGTFFLILFGIISLLTGSLLPHNTILDPAVANSNIIFFIFTIIEIILIVSFLKQEAREEMFHLMNKKESV